MKGKVIQNEDTYYVAGVQAFYEQYYAEKIEVEITFLRKSSKNRVS